MALLYPKYAHLLIKITISYERKVDFLAYSITLSGQMWECKYHIYYNDLPPFEKCPKIQQN